VKDLGKARTHVFCSNGFTEVVYVVLPSNRAAERVAKVDTLVREQQFLLDILIEEVFMFSVASGRLCSHPAAVCMTSQSLNQQTRSQMSAFHPYFPNRESLNSIARLFED